MTGFTPRPYKLHNKIQYYDWGGKNDKAFIPKLLGIEPEQDRPYAELWIGAHPKAPSELEIDGRLVALDRTVSVHPLEILGHEVAHKFSGKFPFLLKVLSAARALSIQAHPDKSQAEELHALHPDLYTDDNHKPEIAIAIDSLNAIAGFKSVSEIVESIKRTPEIGELVGPEKIEIILTVHDEDMLGGYIKGIFASLMRESEKKEKLAGCVLKIRSRLLKANSLSPEEYQFLKQFEQYGTDVGLFSFFFFNMVELKRGQAIFTEAGVPHAYLQGNIVECMANSDNVVRAGLTNKFKDVDTLLEIMKYKFAPCAVINSEQETGMVIYQTPAEEFQVSHFPSGKCLNDICRTGNRPVVDLVLGGSIDVVWNNNSSELRQSFAMGESFLIPATLEEFKIVSPEGADVFTVTVP